MKIELPGIGEFLPSGEEASLLERYRTLRPDYSPNELLALLYIVRCLEFAAWSEMRQGKTHVAAIDILNAAPLMASSVFGEDSRRWLRALDLDRLHR